MMNSTLNLLLHSELVHFILYISMIAIIGGMPAPTASDGKAYCWLFASLNLFAANFHRAASTNVENSPNFQSALNKQQAVQGQRQTTVVQPESPANP
jgi:hypothetical protein